ncbi:MAG: hypothetical protein M3Q65_23230 [Chloroflexota bacterium]|nr:hypothetical protein [Chloroflexota bacterium]
MELRRYWNIVRRYLPLVLAVPLLVGLGSLALYLARPPAYTAQARVQLQLVPPQAEERGVFRYDNYYNFLATEYAADDLVEVLNGNIFAAAVARTLGGPGFNLAVSPEEVEDALVARRAHRVLVIDATVGTPERAIAISRAAARTLGEDPAGYFRRGDAGAQLEAVPLVIGQPTEARSNGSRALFNVVLRMALGLFAGLGLAFLLDYLDDRLRGADAVRETLGLPVLGQIPANGHRRGAREPL